MIKKTNRKKVVHCILSDLCTSVLFNPGFVVLVHAPRSCSNIIYNAMVNIQRRVQLHFKRNLPIISDKIFITGISDKEVIFGGEALIKQAIERIVKIKQPECLLVIAGCTAGVIGDDVQGVCEVASRKYKLPVLAIPGAGFMSEQSREAHLLVTKYLFQQVQDNTVAKNGHLAVILGLNRYLRTEEQRGEIARLFAYFGFTELLFPPCGMSLEEIKNINKASLVAIHALTKAKASAYQEFGKELAAYLQVPLMQQVLPFSIESTYAYLQELGELCQQRQQADSAIAQEKGRWQQAKLSLKKTLADKRFILAIGYTLNVWQPLNLLALLAEAGMELMQIILLNSLTEKEIEEYKRFFTEQELKVELVNEADALHLVACDVVLTSEVSSSFAVQYCYKRRRIGIGGAINLLQGIVKLLQAERSVHFE